MTSDTQPAGSHIITQQMGAVGIITMARPERFNALNVAMARDLRRAALGFARDDRVRCVVLEGADRVFCSGVDLKYIRDGGDEEELSYLRPGSSSTSTGYGARFKEILEYIHSTIWEIRRAAKPFVASVEGVAAAGGFGLAMSCDLVIASSRATFEWAYGKTALTGAESATFLVSRLVGLRKAFQLAMLNPRLSAQEALSAGLITAVVDAEEFDRSVATVAEDLARGPTRSYAVTKSLINAASGMELLDRHLDLELRQLVTAADTPDFAEGLRAFFARETPQFSGSGSN